jgi:hypothetical protein
MASCAGLATPVACYEDLPHLKTTARSQQSIDSVKML